MEDKSTVDEVLDVGALMGRRQAFALVAGRCSAAEAEILFEIREKKLFRTIDATWEDFCAKRLGVTRGYVDRIIRQFKELGPNFSRLNCFTRIKPAEYRRIAGAVTEDGLSYGGEVIALEPDNAPKLAEAVEALRRDSVPEAAPVETTEEVFAKLEKAIKSAVADLERLQATNLDDESQMKLAIIFASCQDQLDLLRHAARP
jgi:hypothetical protein